MNTKLVPGPSLRCHVVVVVHTGFDHLHEVVGIVAAVRAACSRKTEDQWLTILGSDFVPGSGISMDDVTIKRTRLVHAHVRRMERIFTGPGVLLLPVGAQSFLADQRRNWAILKWTDVADNLTAE